MYSVDIAHIDPDISFKTPSYPYPIHGLLFFLVLSHFVVFRLWNLPTFAQKCQVLIYDIYDKFYLAVEKSVKDFEKC